MFIIKITTGIVQQNGNICRFENIDDAINVARIKYGLDAATVYCEETKEAILPLPYFMIPRKNCIGDILPPYVSVDGPLVDEIRELWRKGIYTTGCCSGHYGNPYIGVTPECVEQMEKMDYVHLYNSSDGDIQCTFIPKTK